MKYQLGRDTDGQLSGHLSQIYCALIDGALNEADEAYRRFTSIEQDPTPLSHDSREWIKISDH